MVVLDEPLRAVSEDSREVLEITVAILACDLQLSDRRARFRHTPGKESLTARLRINSDCVLIWCFIASSRALRTAHVEREGGALLRAALVSADECVLGVANRKQSRDGGDNLNKGKELDSPYDGNSLIVTYLFHRNSSFLN